MKLSVKRVYDGASKADGTRVLVDRLWPRGISKDRARITLWLKDAAPSNDLRVWFHEDPEARFSEFQRKYRAELKGNAKIVTRELKGVRGLVTLVTSVKDIERSHIPVLRTFLEKI